MNVSDILLMIIMYCSTDVNKDKCRAERIACVKTNAVSGKQDVITLVDGCLANPKIVLPVVAEKEVKKK